jgi:pyridoxal phosphate-dependent aminotransferase EpsN
MEVLDDRVARRRAIFARYRSELSQPGVAFMPEPIGSRSSRWLTTLTIDPAIAGVTREAVRRALLAKQIESRPLWKPMHLQPLYAATEYVGRGIDEDLFANGLCLPSGSDMSDEQQDEVIALVIEQLRNAT